MGRRTTQAGRHKRGAVLLRGAGRALLGAALVLAAAGCAGSPPAGPPAPAAIVITDDLGRKVSLPKATARVISLAPAHTETLYAIGAGEQVVAADTYSDMPPEVKPKAVLSCWPKPSVEKILSYRPDLVVVLTEPGDFLKQMEAAGVPVLKLLPPTVNRALEEIVLLGRATGRESEARRLADNMRERFARVREGLRGVKPRRFMYEMDAVDPAKPYVAGSGGFYGDLIRLAGGKNVFDDVPTPAGRVSAEEVVARNPEVILLGDTGSPVEPQTPEKVRRRPGWNTVEAVKTGRIYPVDSNLITRAGPRMVDGVETLARLLYPERFPHAHGG